MKIPRTWNAKCPRCHLWGEGHHIACEHMWKSMKRMVEYLSQPAPRTEKSSIKVRLETSVNSNIRE